MLLCHTGTLHFDHPAFALSWRTRVMALLYVTERMRIGPWNGVTKGIDWRCLLEQIDLHYSSFDVAEHTDSSNSIIFNVNNIHNKVMNR